MSFVLTTDGLRGRPAVLWFVAGGCASCAVSIPAVGQHLAAFRAARTPVLGAGHVRRVRGGREGDRAAGRLRKSGCGEGVRQPGVDVGAGV
jgi:hypothetical protein